MILQFATKLYPFGRQLLNNREKLIPNKRNITHEISNMYIYTMFEVFDAYNNRVSHLTKTIYHMIIIYINLVINK